MTAPTQAPVNVEDAAITRTALDYIEGWYDGDAARMERSLHPQLAKRLVEQNVSSSLSAKPGDRLHEMSALRLVQSTRHDPTPAQERRTEVTILDRFENAASVRVDFMEWVDFIHMAKWNGQWVIVNVLWELRPNGQTV
ncbi:MAG: nuclear transport factor 2 family protein [Candidatus Dormibacteraeota bacterium]|nr:nuclear transport factor 2 family protein [Candidatus Dormibacteraeota bacterium]